MAATTPFASDGCSGGMSWAWRRITGTPPPWEDLCVAYDRAYHAGGTPRARKLADIALADGVAARGYPGWARAIYLAVRLGGHPLWPTPWRWGFGHPYWTTLFLYLTEA